MQDEIKEAIESLLSRGIDPTISSIQSLNPDLDLNDENQDFIMKMIHVLKIKHRLRTLRGRYEEQSSQQDNV